VGRTFDVGTRRSVSAFFGVCTMFNRNPERRPQWSPGAAFSRPLSVVPPRLARIGVKMNF
jgi:hypothetical protein